MESSPPSPEPKATSRVLRASILAGVAGAVFATLLIWASVDALIKRDQRARQQISDQTSLRIRDWIENRLIFLDATEKLRGSNHLSEDEQWRFWVTSHTQVLDEFQAINWIDSDGVIRFIAPQLGNESALGKSVWKHPIAAPALEQANESRQLTISPPLSLYQGGRGFTVYLPVYSSVHDRLGYVNGVFRIDRVVSHTLSHIDPTQHGVRISDGETIYTSPTPGIEQTRIFTEFPLRNRTWTVSVFRITPVIKSVWVSFAVLLALGFSWACALITMRVVRSREQLSQTEGRLRQIKRAMEEQHRIEAMGQMARGIAHDFANVLAVIDGRSDLLQRFGDSSDPMTKKSLTAIRDAVKRGEEMTASLSSFSKTGDRDSNTSVDVGQHIRELLPMIEHMFDRGFVSLQISNEPVFFPLSSAELDRVVMNLVMNAKQAISHQKAHIHILVWKDDSSAFLQVTDNGKGMDEETRKRIFEPLFTTKDSGSGLGLATLRSLISQAEGFIDVKSAPGHGASFTIRVPLGTTPKETP